ncbi:MAG: formylglycine-generating enzyme family protein [Rhizonema sp. PD38]|nr:formylglycine-generating enzyme family protein [Rhizonema sp. PD38]
MAGEKDEWWADVREVAELIWCAAHLRHIIAPLVPKSVERLENLCPPDGSSAGKPLEDSTKTTPLNLEETEARTPIATYLKNSERPPASFEERESSSDRASPIRVPDPFPLPKPAEISKSLLPLAKRVPGIWANELDIDASVEQIAKADGLPIMVLRPPFERWFEIHLLIDRSPSMAFWGDLAEGMATLFRWQGFFRDVRVWQFETTNSKPRLFSGAESIEREIRSLIVPGRHRLFVTLTDTLGKAWHSGEAFAALAVLGEQHPVAIAHVFPQTLWRRTALTRAIQRPLVAPQSGCPNSMLKVGARLNTKAKLYQFPIFNLSPNHFKTWANFLAGSGGNSIQGVLIRQDTPTETRIDSSKQVESKGESKETPEHHLLKEFLSDASPEARELAKVLAAVPLIPPVMRLAQQRFLPKSEHWHLAEVFFSGLLQRSPLRPLEATVPETWYEFKAGIRELLLENSAVPDTTEIWREIGDFIQHHYGNLRDFQALIPNPEGSIQDAATDRDLYFAEVQAAVFMTWGGEYASQAKKVSAAVETRKQQKEGSFVQLKGLPPTTTFKFKIATIVLEGETGTFLSIDVQPYEFEVALIEVNNQSAQIQILAREIFSRTGKNLSDVEKLILEGTLTNQTYEQIAASATYSARHLQNSALKLWEVLSEVVGEKVTKRNLQNALEQSTARRLIIHRNRQQAQCFIENLENGVQLEMVAISGGSFMMGSLEDELERRESEGPQHIVTVKPFFLGKCPVTQAQWQVVTSLPKINRELNPNLSRFKGANLPIEQVSWYDTTEFCDRLSRHTGKLYRLPSEAEWEYACRAGTTTPFHFGETITSELANYNAENTYGAGIKGASREKTTPVGSFPANAFGLYDMHGNVWEWCSDHWHDNYQGAPTDGSAWTDENENDNHFWLLRGGSWYNYPGNCRSACRLRYDPGLDDLSIGFRVVCGGVAARTL